MTATDQFDETSASVIASLGESMRSLEQLEVPLENAKVSWFGFAWAIRVVRTAEAIVELHRTGYADAAAPLMRSVMEHAISMHWLLERREEAIDALRYAARRHQRLLRDDAKVLGWDMSGIDPEMLDASLDRGIDEPQDYPRIRDFSQRVGDETRRTWYPAYRIESSLAHASYASASAYWDEQLGFVWAGAQPPTPLRMAAIFVAMTARSLSELIELPQVVIDSIDAAEEALKHASKAAGN